MKTPFRTMLVTDIRKYGRDRNLEVARQVLNAGIEAIYVREKHLDAKELLDFTLEMITLAEPFQARVVVNDRLDVALSSGASGVHLDDDAFHPEAAREQARLLELDDFLIGVQVRNRADVARAPPVGQVTDGDNMAGRGESRKQPPVPGSSSAAGVCYTPPTSPVPKTVRLP